jgi:hypothetical protein
VKLISVDIQGIHGSGQAIMSIVPQPFLASWLNYVSKTDTRPLYDTHGAC